MTRPEVRQGFRQVASGGPHRGDGRLGTVRLPAGTTWVEVHCLANPGPPPASRVQVTVGTGLSWSFTCTDGEGGDEGDGVHREATQTDVSTAEEGAVLVEAPPTVQWNASVQVGAPGA
ncbi:hypothetical protein [Streptomyces sp. DH12]|uniref:hypothetical protein n=1 Tax=Streptomyces sp. DH12 TaxID=2857010 RepID=UPI001E35E863|nr:hypothetical protein [Streptomyces sp. DH12]